MQTSLNQKRCKPCEGVADALSHTEITELTTQLSPNWHFEKQNTTLVRTVTFKNFMQAVEQINQIAQLAEEEGHHPDLNLHNYKQLTITLTTHAIKTLSLNDFILASKIDQLFK